MKHCDHWLWYQAMHPGPTIPGSGSTGWAAELAQHSALQSAEVLTLLVIWSMQSRRAPGTSVDSHVVTAGWPAAVVTARAKATEASPVSSIICAGGGQLGDDGGEAAIG